MKIVTYGMGREEVIAAVQSHAPTGSEVNAVSDYQAATDVKTGAADFAIGVCQSGSGGALAVPRALLGQDLCIALSSPSQLPSEDDIRAAVAAGKRCFGIAIGHIATVIPTLLAAITDAGSAG